MSYHALRLSCLRSSLLLSIGLAAGLVMPSDANAQKPRKGFVLNLGIGPSITRTQAVADFGATGDAETKFGIGTDFKIGHAPTDQLLIYSCGIRDEIVDV